VAAVSHHIVVVDCLCVCVLQMYSLAWKAATGVAAAEGLALGGWSCRNVRTQQAEADKAAAEVVRLRKQATQELAALRALLQQQEVSHSHEVGVRGCVCACVWVWGGGAQATVLVGEGGLAVGIGGVGSGSGGGMKGDRLSAAVVVR